MMGGLRFSLESCDSQPRTVQAPMMGGLRFSWESCDSQPRSVQAPMMGGLRFSWESCSNAQLWSGQSPNDRGLPYAEVGFGVKGGPGFEKSLPIQASGPCLAQISRSGRWGSNPSSLQAQEASSSSMLCIGLSGIISKEERVALSGLSYWPSLFCKGEGCGAVEICSDIRQHCIRQLHITCSSTELG
jgi:hypothetical protein